MVDRSHTPFNVLFLCADNSARSILADAVLNDIGGDRFKAYLAGSTPNGAVRPQALYLLRAKCVDVSLFRSKPWDEFADPARRSWLS